MLLCPGNRRLPLYGFFSSRLVLDLGVCGTGVNSDHASEDAIVTMTDLGYADAYFRMCLCCKPLWSRTLPSRQSEKESQDRAAICCD